MLPRFNAHFIYHFIKHYLSATRIDVLHSPFVFSMYNACIAHQKNEPDYFAVEELRQQLQADSALLIQEDYGAAEETEPVKQKTISEFANLHAKSARMAQIIHRLVSHYGHKQVIELGTSLGITSAYIASALKHNGKPAEVKFTTIEGAPEIALAAKRNMEKLGLQDYVKICTGTFDAILPKVLPQYKQVDLAFIDGNHRYEPTMKYFLQLLPYVTNNSMLIFDDIYWSPGMTKAWNEIKQHPQVRVTVDLFFIGIVMFRKEQAVEHFKLRVF